MYGGRHPKTKTKGGKAVSELVKEIIARHYGYREGETVKGILAHCPFCHYEVELPFQPSLYLKLRESKRCPGCRKLFIVEIQEGNVTVKPKRKGGR